MSTTTTTSQNKMTPEEYAAKYPVITSDGFFGPFAVGNITDYNGRDMINICVKTARSGDRNAVASFPKEWNKATDFAPGDMVNILVESGYIKKVTHAKAKNVNFSAASVNKEVIEAAESIQAEKAVGEVIKEIAQTVPASSTTDDQPF